MSRGMVVLASLVFCFAAAGADDVVAPPVASPAAPAAALVPSDVDKVYLLPTNMIVDGKITGASETSVHFLKDGRTIEIKWSSIAQLRLRDTLEPDTRLALLKYAFRNHCPDVALDVAKSSDSTDYTSLTNNADFVRMVKERQKLLAAKKAAERDSLTASRYAENMEREIASLPKEIDRLDSQIKQAQEQIRAMPTKYTGTIACPVCNGSKREVVDGKMMTCRKCKGKGTIEGEVDNAPNITRDQEMVQKMAAMRDQKQQMLTQLQTGAENGKPLDRAKASAQKAKAALDDAKSALDKSEAVLFAKCDVYAEKLDKAQPRDATEPW